MDCIVSLDLMLVNTAVGKPLLHTMRMLFNIMIPNMLEGIVTMQKLTERDNLGLSLTLESLALIPAEKSIAQFHH